MAFQLLSLEHKVWMCDIDLKRPDNAFEIYCPCSDTLISQEWSTLPEQSSSYIDKIFTIPVEMMSMRFR